ncbi:MAG: peptidoglycan-binding protein [Clostridia bacterium]|nr:peptidoglycan-binding protein [Clostridia bacterium]
MAYENLCMYCFEDMDGKTTCPHCGKDSRAAVPQIQMLPGSQVYHGRFLVGRALGQDATGIVYAAFDTKKENRLRIREYLPRDCAERLNDGAVVPLAGMEDQFEAGFKKLRASVENVEDPRKRHFFFEENGTAYIAQRKSASAAAERDREPEEEDERGGKGRVLVFAGIAVAVLVVAAVLLITVFNGAVTTSRDITQSPTLDPSQVWIPEATPTVTPYVSPTFAALVDPELSWMDYTYDGDVEQEYQEAQRAASTPVPTPVPTVGSKGSSRYKLVNGDSSTDEIRALQKQLYELGWLKKGQVTGKYDADTRQAIRDFQAYVNEQYKPREKLSVDGAAGPKTQQWLYEAGASKPTPRPTPKVTPKPNDGTVDESSPANTVRRVQRQLIALGLLPEGSADGSYGATTVAAVRRFQKRVNELAGYDVLEVTGKLDAQSLAFLDYYAEEWETLRKATAEPTATPRPTRRPTPTPTTRPVEVLEGVINGKASKADIRKVQQLLADIGMLSKGGVDGVYGSSTISAVADFQQWVNDQRNEETLTVNGEVDQMTLLYLQYCKDHGLMPYGTPTPRPTKQPTPKPTMTPTPEPLEPEIELDQDIDVEGVIPEEQPVEVEPEGDAEGGEISVSPTSDRESIRYVQEMLSAVGAMNANGVDGVYGKGTARAVRRFQKWVNSVQGAGTVPEDGKVDDRTRQALEYAYEHGLNINQAAEEPTPTPTEAPVVVTTPEPLEPEEEPEAEAEGEHEITVDGDSDPESIRFIQEMLNATGLLAEDDVNGVYDEATVDAVRRFQAWVNSARGKAVLEVNGRMDDLTRQALEYAFEHKMRVEPEATEAEPEPEVEVELDPELAEPENAEEVPTPVPVAEVGAIDIAFGDQVSDGEVVSIPEGKVNVRWRAEGDVDSYAVYVTDGSGTAIVEQEGIQDTGFTIDTRRMNPGEVYTLRLGVLPRGGVESDILWQTARFMLPAPEVEETPEPEPEPEPEPQVGVVSAPEIAIAGEAAGGEPVVIEADSFELRWRAEGDLQTYYVRITDSTGSDIMEPQFTTQTSATLRTVNMEVGEVYTLSVGAVPVNGEREDMVVSEARFVRAEEATPEPTEVPTPAPQVATIGTPVVTIGGSAYQKDGISYMTDSSIIISWNADGDVESYTIYVENEMGERQELGTTTDTSRTVNARSLPAGIYTIYVGAMPRGGGSSDVVWGTTHFAIPAPEVEAAPEAEAAPEGGEAGDEPQTEEGGAQAPAIVDGATIGEISAASAPEIIQQLQMRLYSLGLLSTDGLEPGVLDAQTLQAVAEFQQRVNEQYGAGLEIVDPADPAAVVDAVTVSALFAENN